MTATESKQPRRPRASSRGDRATSAVASPFAGARAPHTGERATVERTSGDTLFPSVRSSRNPKTLDLPSSSPPSFSQPHEHAPGSGTVVRFSISPSPFLFDCFRLFFSDLSDFYLFFSDLSDFYLFFSDLSDLGLGMGIEVRVRVLGLVRVSLFIFPVKSSRV